MSASFGLLMLTATMAAGEPNITPYQLQASCKKLSTMVRSGSIAAVVCPFNCRPDPRLVRLRMRRKRTLADLTREFSGSDE
jgi:hypothetical protein